MKSIAAAALLACLSVLFFSFPTLALEPGAAAPDFKLRTLEGKKVKLSDFKGEVIVLKLATTWCPTCKQQTEEVQEIGDFLQQKKAVYIEVFVQDSAEMVRDHLKDLNFPMRHVALLDDGKVVKAYNVYLIPRMLVIGPDFKVRHDGSLITADDLKKQVMQAAGGS